jgi:hypothetical protein
MDNLGQTPCEVHSRSVSLSLETCSVGGNFNQPVWGSQHPIRVPVRPILHILAHHHLELTRSLFAALRHSLIRWRNYPQQGEAYSKKTSTAAPTLLVVGQPPCCH